MTCSIGHRGVIEWRFVAYRHLPDLDASLATQYSARCHNPEHQQLSDSASRKHATNVGSASQNAAEDILPVWSVFHATGPAPTMKVAFANVDCSLVMSGD